MRLRLQPLGPRSVRRLFNRDLTEARAKPAPPLKRRRKRRRGLQPLALLALAPLAFSGCGSSDKTAVSTQTEPAWSGVPATGTNLKLVKAFNTYLTKRKGPVSPTQLALEFVRADRTQAARTSTKAQSSPEGGGPTTVTVVQDGLADDSVRATQDVLRFVPSGANWRLKSAVRTQRCQPGRGHQSFAPGNCV